MYVNIRIIYRSEVCTLFFFFLVIWRKKNINKNKVRYAQILNINFSSLSIASLPFRSYLPIPIKVFPKLDDYNIILSCRELLKNKAGVYCFVNTVNNKLYIGSAKDLYLRLIEYLSNKKSNIALQNVIAKYGLAKFNFSISEYFIYDSKGVSQKALTNLETSYIDKYPFHVLYNFIKTTTSLTGCFFSSSGQKKRKKWNTQTKLN